MSISANSKILASDVSGKIDTAGTGLTKSGTTLSLASLHSANGTIGSSSAQTLSYSGTFTIPYVTRDVYGRVSGGGTRTITMPAKPSGGTATAIGNVASAYGSTVSNCTYSKSGDYGRVKLPSGGQWRYFAWGGNEINGANTVAGGSTINVAIVGTASHGDTFTGGMIAIRVS